MRAPAPAPDSTRISSPACCSLPSASGTRATRRSPGAVSLATPTFMGTTCSGRDAGTDAGVGPHGQSSRVDSLPGGSPRCRAPEVALRCRSLEAGADLPEVREGRVEERPPQVLDAARSAGPAL